jgi:hypothetical protein
MSLSFQPLEAVCCVDELVNVERQRTYAVIKSGSQTTYKPFNTTSISNSALNFSCPPPSAGVFVSRKQYLYCPVRLTFTGIPPVGQSIIMPNRDAPRAFPISSIIETLQATINNQSVSVNVADIIHAMAHYNTDEDCKNLDYSTFPSYEDQSQVYGDLFLSNRSPLSTYGTSQDGTQIGRAGFPGMVIFSNPVQTVAGTLLTSIVDLASCEPLFLSPFYFGKGNACGFFNVSTLDYNFTLIGQAANRLWSHDDNGGTNVIQSISMVMGGLTGGPDSFTNMGGNRPNLLFQYVTPLETQVIPPDVPITYPYFDIQRYPTDQFSFDPGASGTINSNNLQISQVPRKMYIYVRQRNSDLYASSTNTDTFFQIQNVNIQFLNNTGLLAPQTMQQLYLMSVKNGCKMGWQQWSGGPVYSNDFTSQIGTIGSVVCVEFCTDIGMANPLLTAGVLNQCMIQVNATVKNVSSNAIFATMYVVMVLEGSFTITSVGSATVNTGCLSPNDVLDCHNKPGVSLQDAQDVHGSGDFWSGLKNFGSKLFNFVKDNKLISKGLSLIPHPIAQVGSRAAKSVGFGNAEMMGGRHLSRAQMRRRLNQY